MNFSVVEIIISSKRQFKTVLKRELEIVFFRKLKKKILFENAKNLKNAISLITL
jgi:hypothetical protein